MVLGRPKLTFPLRRRSRAGAQGLDPPPGSESRAWGGGAALGAAGPKAAVGGPGRGDPAVHGAEKRRGRAEISGEWMRTEPYNERRERIEVRSALMEETCIFPLVSRKSE